MACADRNGLRFESETDLPANNKMIVFRA